MPEFFSEFFSDDFMPHGHCLLWRADLGDAARRWDTVYAESLNTPSDARLKEEIRDLDRGLETVLALRPVRYRWRERPGQGVQMGLIAQELREVLPEIVHEADDGEGSLSVEYLQLLPVLIRALQEQQERLQDQSERIADLEKRLEN